MSLRFIGQKKGMTRFFDKEGNQIVCTVIVAEPNVVAQVKNQETDGYQAVQLAGMKRKSRKNVSKALQGHFTKAGIDPYRRLLESRVDNLNEYQVGQSIDVDYFKEISHVDVQGVSKGKGYQGVMKRHHFSGGPAAHGSGFHRHAGSTGMRSTPGRCLPGVKKAGRMGGDVVTIQNLRIVRVDAERHVLLIEGAIPGPSNGLVYITKAKKKIVKKNK